MPETISNRASDNIVFIQKAMDGDQSAFRQIYEDISGKMYSLCLRYISDAEEAKDVFQDGFIKLYRNLGHYRFEGSFEGWARRIFVTTCLDHLKKKRLDTEDIKDGYETAGNFTDAVDKLSLDKLMEVIQSLPDGHRTIVNLSLVEELSHKEIAELLNITESNSKSRLHKARIVLKEKLMMAQ